MSTHDTPPFAALDWRAVRPTPETTRKPGSAGARAGIALLIASLAGAVQAQSLLDMPETARPVIAESERAGRYLIPTAPWENGGVPAFEAEGVVQREVWQIAEFSAGTGVLLAVLSGQFQDAGFEPLFICEARVCGGFDFRFALDIAPEPEMHVNLADFAYFAGRRDGDDGPEYTTLIVSEGGGTGFVQAVHVGPPGDLSGVTLSSRTPDMAAPLDAGAAPTADLARNLTQVGRAPLPGVSFDYGSTELTDPEAPVLGALADYLNDNPEVRLTLVGHTDAEGGLASNIAVSRARAAAVRTALIERFGISADRLQAEGVGFLMPLAPNTTQDGRDMNRRVEAVVINTE